MMIDEDYYYDCEKKFDNLEKEWKSKKISNEFALQTACEWRKALVYVIASNVPTPSLSKISSLVGRLDKFTGKIKEEMKTIYVLRTDKTKMIACADESLVKKCIERLGKDTLVATYKMKICKTEEDLDRVLENNLEA